MNDSSMKSALDLMVRDIDPPADLAPRTMDALRAMQRQSLRDRWRARLDSRRVRVSGYPRWVYMGTAVAAVLMLFAIGTFVTWPPTSQRNQQNQHLASRELGGQATQSQAFIAGNSNGATRNVGAPNPAAFIPLKELPKIVRTAEIKVQVRDFERSWRNANDIAGRNGGFVTTTNTEQSGDHVASGTLTMRVPSGELDGTLKDLRNLGTMTNLTTSGTDVSAPIADLNARLKNAQAEETQLLQLLNNANNLSEVLDTRNRLNQNRSEIESIKAQIAGYQNKVDYSTINATVFEKGAGPKSPGKPILGGGIIGSSIRAAISIGLTMVAGTIVVLGGLLPLALLVLAVWFIVRWIRRRTA